MERIFSSMSVQRQVWPLQCTAAPPTTSPGRNEPRRRIGSASCETLLRTVDGARAARLVGDVGQRMAVRGRAHAAALKRHHLEAALRQLLRQNAAGPAEAD